MKKTISYYPYKGVKLEDYPFKNKSSWEYNLKELLKKEDVEIHTNDLCDIKKINGALVFDNIFYGNLDIMWDLYNNKKLENSVYINYEPITGHARNHDEEGMKHLANIFNKIITFDDDLVDGNKFIKGNIANFFSSEIPYKKDFKNRKFLTMITNNTNVDSIIYSLNLHNNTHYYNRSNVLIDEVHSIYKEREKAATYFMNKCPDEFDLYGALWPEKYNKVLRGSVSREEKQQKLSLYKFAISYDSYTNQNGYISEKIFDCFMSKVVPIYLGANNVEKYIPRNCFINKNDYKSYDDLYNYLVNMDEETYNNYIENIERYLKSDNFNKYFSSMSSAKVLKESLLDTGKIDYDKAYESLMYFTNKRDELYKDCSYGLDRIHYDTHKISVNFGYKNFSNLRIESNGLDEFKTIHMGDKYNFVEYFNYDVDNLYIKIYDLDKNCYLPLFSIDDNTNHEFGLINKSIDVVVYKNYVNMKPINKLIYVLLHNRNKIYKKFHK